MRISLECDASFCDIVYGGITMTVLKKSVCLLLVVTMLFTVAVSTTLSASAAAFTIQRQTDSKWKTVYVGGRTMSATACGIFSLVNAIGYLTGSAPDVYQAAVWAHSIGAYNTATAGGTFRTALYPRIQAKYGSTYGFTCDCGSGNTGYWSTAASSTLKAHLANGGVAIGHVPGHFIALVGYDYSTNKFHVYDSAPSTSRGTYSYGATGLGDCWVTQSRLSTGKLDLDWFCLLTATGTPAQSQANWTIGDYSLLGNKYLRDSASTSSNTIVTIPKGEVMQVIEIVNGNFGKTQWGDYVGYILLDEDTQRISDFIHGGTTITSSDVRLPDNDYTAAWNDCQGAAGYHYKIIELDGAPDSGNSNESGTVLVDETAYLYQTLSVTVPAASMTNGKYLKIAVEVVFPGGISYWTTKYVSCSELPFTDVPAYAWYYAPVLYAYQQDYIGGVTATTFEPDSPVSRAMLVTVLHRMAGSPAPKSTTTLPYSDVASDAWYLDSLKWCYEQGLVDSASAFNSGSSVSRESAAISFCRFAEVSGKNTEVTDFLSILYFEDAMSINDTCYNEMAWAVQHSILGAAPGNVINPGTSLSRGELAAAAANFDLVDPAE